MNALPHVFSDFALRIEAPGSGTDVSEALRQRWAMHVLREGRSVRVRRRERPVEGGMTALMRDLQAKHGGTLYESGSKEMSVLVHPSWFVDSTPGGMKVYWAGDTPPSIVGDIDGAPDPEKPPRVLWWRMSSHGLLAQPMELTGADGMQQFYPWLDCPMDRLWDDYMASTASVLLLIGPPGTGKTSFLRAGLRRLDSQVWLTYDPAVQRNEELYTRFAEPGRSGGDADDDDEVLEALGGRRTFRPRRPGAPNGRVLVLEDADLMLESRKDGNDLMRRILGVADGLVSLPQRKVVFTTNLPSLSSVDEALLRPGRCFGILNFRKLSADEAAAAASAVGIEREFAPGSYSLAEALQSRRGNDSPVRRLGF